MVVVSLCKIDILVVETDILLSPGHKTDMVSPWLKIDILYCLQLDLTHKLSPSFQSILERIRNTKYFKAYLSYCPVQWHINCPFTDACNSLLRSIAWLSGGRGAGEEDKGEGLLLQTGMPVSNLGMKWDNILTLRDSWTPAGLWRMWGRMGNMSDDPWASSETLGAGGIQGADARPTEPPDSSILCDHPTPDTMILPRCLAIFSCKAVYCRNKRGWGKTLKIPIHFTIYFARVFFWARDES